VSTIVLPSPDRTSQTWLMHPSAGHPDAAGVPTSRTVFAAAHVVADPLHAACGASPGAVDWVATMRQRRRIWSLGLGVAEAMDTAQRGMGITWTEVQRLVEATLSEGRACGGQVVVGIATDTLPAGRADLSAITDAYLEQLAFVEELGGSAVLMPSRQLAVSAASSQDYVNVYDAVISAAQRPVVLHWLGEAFDRQLRGYWGSLDLDVAAETVLAIIKGHVAAIEGIKISALDPSFEVRLRAVLEPTLALSRLIFEAPTSHYKTGIVWLAYLQGMQDHFRMLGGMEGGRSTLHLVNLFKAADEIGLFDDPDLAAARMSGYLNVQGMA
jgi:hypothetical protein